MTDVIEEIRAERLRQIEKEGWSLENDDRLVNHELSDAAASYALQGDHIALVEGTGGLRIIPRFWPWDRTWWKPTTRRRNLIKAAALIVAEIERLDRKGSANISMTEIGNSAADKSG